MFMLNNIDNEKLKEFSTMSIITGILMVLAGIFAIINPLAGSVAFVIFIGAVFISAGCIQGYITFKAHQKSLGAWFKVFLLFVTGALLLIWPASGIAAIAILFAAYFFMDSFASLGMALDLRPLKGWGLTALNGVLSFLLGIIMLVGWPFSAPLTVGIIVGISFLMDGFVLIYLGWLAKNGHYD